MRILRLHAVSSRYHGASMTPPAAPHPCPHDATKLFEDGSRLCVLCGTRWTAALVPHPCEPICATPDCGRTRRQHFGPLQTYCARDSSEYTWTDPRPVSPEAAPPRCVKCGSALVRTQLGLLTCQNAPCERFAKTAVDLLAEAAPPRATTPTGSCLVCGYLREFAVWHETTLAGVCRRCRDARHVVSGGTVVSTPRTHDEFMAALDRIMQHYLGEDAPEYGDARFVVDYALSLEDRLRAPLAAHPATTPEPDDDVTPWLDKVGPVQFLDEVIEAIDAGKPPMVHRAEFVKLRASLVPSKEIGKLIDAAVSAAIKGHKSDPWQRRREDLCAAVAALEARASEGACQHPMRIHNYTARTGWQEGVCGEPMPCAIHVSPSRDRGALLVSLDKLYLGTLSDADAQKARDDIRSALSTLERDAARMREQVRDYQARMMGAGALLCEPVSSKNLREAKAFLNPAYHDAAEAYRAARALTPSGEPTTTPETSDNGE